jgi:NitT/TauT family transport system substrate-binding protein
MKRMFIPTICALLMLTAAGCDSTTSTTSSTQGKAPLRIGWTLWPGFYPLVLAQSRGVNMQPVFYENTRDLSADYAAGKLDGALVKAYDILPLNTRQSANLSPIVLVTNSTTDADAIVATANIQTPADLKGKKLGVAFDTYAEMQVRNMLEKYGVSTNEVTLIDLPPEKVVEEMGRGTIDAGHTYEPYLSQAIDAGYHAIFTNKEMPNQLLDVLTVRDSVLKERPADVRALITGFLSAQESWRQTQGASARIIAEATGLNPDNISLDGLRLYDRADNIEAFLETNNANSLYNSLDGILTYLLNTGILDSQPDLTQLINANFIQ